MKKSLIILIVLITLIVPGIVMAADANTGGADANTGAPATNSNSSSNVIPTLQNPLKAKNVTQVLFSIVDLAIFIGIIFAVLMFVFIGFKFVLAQGNDSALKEAKQWFLYAVIGTAVLISSKVIVEVMKNTLISAGVVNESLFNRNL